MDEFLGLQLLKRGPEWMVVVGKKLVASCPTHAAALAAYRLFAET